MRNACKNYCDAWFLYELMPLLVECACLSLNCGLFLDVLMIAWVWYCSEWKNSLRNRQCLCKIRLNERRETTKTCSLDDLRSLSLCSLSLVFVIFLIMLVTMATMGDKSIGMGGFSSSVGGFLSVFDISFGRIRVKCGCLDALCLVKRETWRQALSLSRWGYGIVRV